MRGLKSSKSLALIGIGLSLLYFTSALAKDKNFSLHAELSYTKTSGNTKADSFSASYQMKKLLGQWTLHSDGSFLYTSSLGKMTANSLSLNAKVERNLSEKLSTFVSAGFCRDKFAGYKGRYSSGAGLGWKIISTDSTKLKLYASTDYMYTDYIDSPNDSSWFGKLSMSYSYQVAKSTSVGEDASYMHSFKESRDYYAKSKTYMNVQINENLSLGISYTIKYQNLPPEGYGKFDRLFLTSLIIDI